MKAPAFPIVAIGASAGGFEACSALLSNLPGDTGMAFVIIQHLAPAHESMLAKLLAKSTRMPVREVRNGLPVEPNRVYVIPPGKSMTLADGRFRLAKREGATSHVIDDFFRSLAAAAGSRSIGVVLSGTASDGVIGLESIKAEGGLAVCQDEKSAKYPGMPHAAISSGAADLVLPPARIAKELVTIARHPYLSMSDAAERAAASDRDPLDKLFRLVRQATGTDFTFYKRSTIMRRIARRMALQRLRTLAEYAAFAEKRPGEAAALGSDLLIRVTGFFRDPRSFEHLRRRVLPRLLREREKDAPLRVWVAGCATGEEAYTVAMCALDAIGGRAPQVTLQVFGTDANEAAVQRARYGFYPEFAVAAVPRPFLRRYFVKVDGGYQVSKLVRDACVFAKQDVTRDPPFSRLDLVCCRNVLIYLEPSLQKRVLGIFHYALRPKGMLMLGSSETVGGTTALFQPVDRRERVYLKRSGLARAAPPLQVKAAPAEPAHAPARPAAPSREGEVLRRADQILLARYTSPSVLVDEHGDIVQFRGDTAPYLAPASGRASLNVLRMAREGLAFELKGLLEETARRGRPGQRAGVRVERGGRVEVVTVRAVPLSVPDMPGKFTLVLFETAAAEPAPLPAGPGRGGKDRQITRLRQELAQSRESLQAVIEQHEAANEELQSSNEEILSANEEMQSTNEELESAKEELQSVNEELTTVNEELQHRNVELSQLNDDLNNLIAGVNIPVIILGADLRIRRFTSFAERTLNLIPADVGRPITDIKLSIPVPDLKDLVEEVIDGAVPRQVDAQDAEGRWYQVRVRPYKTREHRIDGAVLLFVDVDALKNASERHREAREYAEAVLETLHQPLLVVDAKLQASGANRAFYETFRRRREEVAGRSLASLAGGSWSGPVLRRALREVLDEDAVCRDLELEAELPGLGRRALRVNARRVRGGGSASAVVAVEDVTERRQAQEARELRRRAGLQSDFVANVSHELLTPIAAIRGAAETLLAAAPRTPEARRRGLEIVERNAERLSRLVEDMLRLSSVESGRRKPEPRRIALEGYVKAFLEQLEPLASSRGVRLRTHLERGAAVWADKVHLDAVMQSLCENALAANRPGGTLAVSARSLREEAVITVRDQGRGIPAGELQRIFDYFRGRGRGGTVPGLGLPLAKVLVEANGGRISVVSAKGEGTTVSFTLPLPKAR